MTGPGRDATWHVGEDVLDLYARGAVDDVRAFSVETHLLTCGECRGALAARADAARLEAVWYRIDETVRASRRAPVERLLLGAGAPEHIARLLAATPSLSVSWLGGLALALGFAVLAARAAPQGFFLFLVLAPLLPLAGVAVAYGPRVDPTYEVGVAAPMSSFGLLLVRAGAVLAATTAIAALAALALPGLGWTAAAWLLPSLALVTTSLGLASFVGYLRAAAAVAGAWISFALAAWWMALGPTDLRALFGAPLQLCVAAATVAAAVLLALRRDTFERGGTA